MDTTYTPLFETNPLVLSGEYVRVFTSEIRVGEVNAFGEAVTEHQRIGGTVAITFDNTETLYWSNPTSTLLIRADSISKLEDF